MKIINNPIVSTWNFLATNKNYILELLRARYTISTQVVHKNQHKISHYIFKEFANTFIHSVHMNPYFHRNILGLENSTGQSTLNSHFISL